MLPLIGIITLSLLIKYLEHKKERHSATELIQRGLCPPCNGSGQVTIYRNETTRQWVTCDGFHCSNGRRAGDRDMPCSTCGGSGKVMRDVTTQVPVGTAECQTCRGDGKFVPGSYTVANVGLLDRICDFLWAVISIGVFLFGLCCAFGMVGAAWQTALGQGSSANDTVGQRIGLLLILLCMLIVTFFLERWLLRHFKRFIRDAFT